MKKLFTSMLCVFIAIPLLLTVWGFALPAQYSGTFLGELPAKRALLAALLPVLRRFAQSYAALGPAAKKTIEALLPELAALLEAAEGAMQ